MGKLFINRAHTKYDSVDTGILNITLDINFACDFYMLFAMNLPQVVDVYKRCTALRMKVDKMPSSAFHEQHLKV